MDGAGSGCVTAYRPRLSPGGALRAAAGLPEAGALHLQPAGDPPFRAAPLRPPGAHLVPHGGPGVVPGIGAGAAPAGEIYSGGPEGLRPGASGHMIAAVMVLAAVGL